MKVLKKYSEGFNKDQAYVVIEKLARFLTKKLGTKVEPSLVPITYKNAYGIFEGYWMNARGYNTLLRVNFKITKSASISSIDFYQILKSIPSYTIDTDAMNIVQVSDLILEELTGEDLGLVENTDAELLNYLNERSSSDKQQMIEWFVEQVPEAFDAIQNWELSKVFNKLYMPWAGDNIRAKMPFGAFVQLMRAYLLDRGLTNSNFKKRKKGTKDRVILDKSLDMQFQDIVDNIDVDEKFEMIDFYTDKIAQGNLQSMVIYGSPGSGKTQRVKDYLRSEGLNFKYFIGGLKNTEALVKILYTYKDDEIIIFDDFDSVLKVRESINIFKAILNNSKIEEREVVWLGSEIRLADGTKVPPRFIFNSGVIFISNSSKFDPAILSRSAVVEIHLSNEQMIKKIEDDIENFMPEVDIQIKMEVLEYLKEIEKGVQTVDFRKFELALSIYTAFPDNKAKAKRWILAQLKSSEF